VDVLKTRACPGVVEVDDAGAGPAPLRPLRPPRWRREGMVGSVNNDSASAARKLIKTQNCKNRNDQKTQLT